VLILFVKVITEQQVYGDLRTTDFANPLYYSEPAKDLKGETSSIKLRIFVSGGKFIYFLVLVF